MSGPTAAIGHMPFAGHRSCAEWISNERSIPSIRRALQDSAVQRTPAAESAFSDAEQNHCAPLTDERQRNRAAR